jgi:hypothetical protein
MKANLKPGGEDGPEREALRAFLRHWRVGGPPSDLEEDLRRTFRRRRPGRRPVVWIALAVMPRERPVPPGRPAAAVSPRPAPALLPGPGPMVRQADAAAAPPRPARARRARVVPAREPDVVVEPGQAELLVRLGRELRNVEQVAPGTAPPRVDSVAADAPQTPIPQVPAPGAPAYRATWEAVAGEWPFIHRAVPGSGR